METWIRSQDREYLGEVNYVQLREVQNRTYKYGDIGKPQEYAIESEIILGQYKTKERALEVLDEIQRHIIKSLKFKENKINKWSQVSSNENYSIDIPYYENIVYEMPKE